MAYIPLDESNPGDAEKARFGASRIRSIATAVRQRLESIFVDSDADPMVLKDDTVGTGQLKANSVTGAKIVDETIELTKLSDAARLGFYKIDVYEFTVPAATPAIGAGGNFFTTVVTPASTNGLLMFVTYKPEALTGGPLAAAQLAKLLPRVWPSIGAGVNFMITNLDAAPSADISGSVWRIAVFTPIP